MIKTWIEKLKALRIYAIMCRFLYVLWNISKILFIGYTLYEGFNIKIGIIEITYNGFSWLF